MRSITGGFKRPSVWESELGKDPGEAFTDGRKKIEIKKSITGAFRKERQTGPGRGFR